MTTETTAAPCRICRVRPAQGFGLCAAYPCATIGFDPAAPAAMKDASWRAVARGLDPELPAHWNRDPRLVYVSAACLSAARAALRNLEPMRRAA
jgi:hypothetical protein